MYKTKLQEFCHKRSWDLPVYSTSTEGSGHSPRHTATVTVNGVDFHNPTPCRTVKEAQNNAAKLAFDHFFILSSPFLPNSPSSFPPSNSNSPSFPNPSFPQPYLPQTSLVLSNFPQPSLPQSSSPSPSDLPGPVTDDDRIFLARSVFQPKLREASKTSQINSHVAVVEDDMKARDQRNDLDMQRLYKNKLQHYAQKRNLSLPVYTFEQEGPPHNIHFKCKVTIDGQIYESSEFFPTLKDAEHAAAKVALMSLSTERIQEDDTSLYKNLLQELVQKRGLHLPIYSTQMYGEAHIPIFISSVKLEGEVFTGEAAKTKKQAEMNAAKIAYKKLQERKGKSDQSSLISSSTHHGQAPKLSSPSLESNVTTGLQHNANLTSISPRLVTQNLLNKDEAGDEVSIHGTAIPPLEPVKVRKRGLSSSGITNGVVEDASLSNDCYAPLLSNCSNVALASSDMPSTSASTPSHKRLVTVFSRKANVSIPEGVTLLPISDEQWDAYSYSS